MTPLRGSMEFRILGSLEVRDGRREVILGGPKQRKLFARLLIDRNRVVSVESLVETLWPDGLPSDPSHQIQVYVSQIRKALGHQGAALETVPPGYRFRVDPEDVDLDRFDTLCAAARSALEGSNFVDAIALCDDALKLWRGPFLHDFEGEGFAYPDSVRAEAQKEQVAIDRLTASLGIGRADSLIPELEARTAAKPSDERYALLLMQALNDAGRQNEAIEAFHRCRTALADDLGVDPSSELQEMFIKMLRSEPHERTTREPEPADVGGQGALPHRAQLSRSQFVVGALLLALAVAVAAVAVLTRGPLDDEIAGLRPQALSVIDPATGRIEGNLTLPVRPTRAAYGFDALWITSASAGQVMRVDPETLSIRQTIDVGPGAGPISFADSAVWVASGDDGMVTRIDPKTNEVVQEVRVGNGPADIAVAGDHLWISNQLDASVVKFDPRRGAVVDRIPTGASPGRLAATDDSLWVTDEVLSIVGQVDLSSEAVSTVHVGNSPGPVAAIGDDVWVVNRSDETVSRIGDSGSVEALGESEQDVTSIVGVGGEPWVGYQDGIAAIDPEDPTSSDVVATGAASTDLSFGGDKVWVVTEPSSAEHSGGTLRLIGASPDSLDPAKAYIPDSWRVLDVLNDGLVAYGGQGGRSLVANLATRLPTPSDGGKTYVFRLRDGINYSTGEEVAPEDVKHSLERLVGGGSPIAESFAAIRGAGSCGSEGCDLSRGILVSEDTRTITFHLRYADPDFLSKLATPAASILPATVPMKIQRSVPSTGPYEVVSLDLREQIVLERRDDFQPWAVQAQPAGYADRIVIDFDRSGKSANDAVLEGDADWTDLLSVSAVSELRRRHGSQINVFPQAVTYAIFLNTEVPPFDDVEVRRALNFAIDREKVQTMFGGPEQAPITCQVLPPGTQGYEPYCPYTSDPGSSGAWRGTDVARAKRLLRGKERVPVTVSGFSEHAGTVEHVAEVLKDLGYPAKSRIMGIGRYFRRVSTKPDIQAGVFGWYADAPGASTFIRPTLSCAGASEPYTSNYSHLCEPAIDRLSKKAGAMQFSDVQRANELWARVDRRLTLTAAWVPLVNEKGTDLVSERVGNYTYSPVTGMVLSQAWVK